MHISKTRLEEPWHHHILNGQFWESTVAIPGHLIDVLDMSPVLPANCKEVVGHKALDYRGTPKLIPCSGVWITEKDLSISLPSFLFIKRALFFQITQCSKNKGTGIMCPSYCTNYWNFNVWMSPSLVLSALTHPCLTLRQGYYFHFSSFLLFTFVALFFFCSTAFCFSAGVFMLVYFMTIAQASLLILMGTFTSLRSFICLRVWLNWCFSVFRLFWTCA